MLSIVDSSDAANSSPMAMTRDSPIMPTLSGKVTGSGAVSASRTPARVVPSARVMVCASVSVRSNQPYMPSASVVLMAPETETLSEIETSQSPAGKSKRSEGAPVSSTSNHEVPA